MVQDNPVEVQASVVDNQAAMSDVQAVEVQTFGANGAEIKYQNGDGNGFQIEHQNGDQNGLQNGDQNGSQLDQPSASGDAPLPTGKVNGNKFTNVYQTYPNGKPHRSNFNRYNGSAPQQKGYKQQGYAPAQVNYQFQQNQFPTAGQTNGTPVPIPAYNGSVWNKTPVAKTPAVEKTTVAEKTAVANPETEHAEKEVNDETVDAVSNPVENRESTNFHPENKNASENRVISPENNYRTNYTNHNQNRYQNRAYNPNYNANYPLIQIDDLGQLLSNPIPKAYHRSPDIKLASELENSEKEQLRKLFIGGLSYQTDDKTLYEHFSKYGDLTDCVVMKDPRTKRSRGFGFVCFQKASMLEICMADRPHTINGRPVEPKRAVSRLESGKPGANRSVNKLHVKWAPPAVLVKPDFEKYFSKYGEIRENGIEIPKNKETGASRNYAFISFTDYDVVDKIISSGKKAVQQTPRNSAAVNEAMKQLEAEKKIKSEKDAKSDDSKSNDDKSEKPESPESENVDESDKVAETEVNTEETETKTEEIVNDKKESNSEDKSDSGSLPNSNIILSQVKAKDLVNQHTINGVTCHVNKGFSQDEMKEIKNNMAEKHSAMERAKARNFEHRNGMNGNNFRTPYNGKPGVIGAGAPTGVQMQNGVQNGVQNGMQTGVNMPQNGHYQNTSPSMHSSPGQAYAQNNGQMNGYPNQYSTYSNQNQQNGQNKPRPYEPRKHSPKPANPAQKYTRQNSGQNSGNHSSNSGSHRQTSPQPFKTNNNRFDRSTNSPRNKVQQNGSRYRDTNRDQSTQPGVLGRYQGPPTNMMTPTSNHRTTGGHVTHNPPHLDENEHISASMAEQITGLSIDQDGQNVANGYGIYGYNQLYPTFPYGYDANYYYQQSYYHQMANTNPVVYPQQSLQYQQVLPQNVKPSPGLWVPPKVEGNSTGASNANSEDPEISANVVTVKDVTN